MKNIRYPVCGLMLALWLMYRKVRLAMKKMKILALFLSLVMTLGIMSSCNGDTADVSSASSITSSEDTLLNDDDGEEGESDDEA